MARVKTKISITVSSETVELINSSIPKNMTRSVYLESIIKKGITKASETDTLTPTELIEVKESIIKLFPPIKTLYKYKEKIKKL